jgi:hypothetical protein
MQHYIKPDGTASLHKKLLERVDTASRTFNTTLGALSIVSLKCHAASSTVPAAACQAGCSQGPAPCGRWVCPAWGWMVRSRGQLRRTSSPRCPAYLLAPQHKVLLQKLLSMPRSSCKTCRACPLLRIQTGLQSLLFGTSYSKTPSRAQSCQWVDAHDENLEINLSLPPQPSES